MAEGEAKMENAPDQTKFNDLPDLVKEQIFQTLDSDPNGDLKNARAVCKSWYIFLSTHNFKIGGTLTNEDTENDSESLKLLESSFQPELAQLVLKNCKKQLPIMSSTRVKIPTARNVILKDGISQDNLRALLLYYSAATTTKVLTLVNECFLKTAATFMKTNPRQAYRFFNLSTLSIISGHPITQRSLPHWNSLTNFLRHVQIPGLTTFNFRHNCQGTGGTAELMWTNLVGAFEAFLKRHGMKMRSMNLCLLAAQYSHVLALLPHMNYLVNLEELRCSYTGSKAARLVLTGTTDQKMQLNTAFKTLFEALKNLRSLVLMTADQELQLSQILSQASPSLSLISIYLRGFNQIGWLHQHAELAKTSNVRLLDLYFSVRNNPFRDILAKPGCTNMKYKLLNLETIKLLIFRERPTNPQPVPVNAGDGPAAAPVVPPPLEVYEHCVDWIITFAPNLRRLQVSFYSDQNETHEFSLEQMAKLVERLPKLEEFAWNKVYNYGVQQERVFIPPTNPSPTVANDPRVQELKDWAAQSTSNIGFTFSDRRTKNYHYTNFADGLDSFLCMRMNREVFKVY